MNLEDYYYRAWHSDSPIAGHCPTLRLLASECERVAEIGTESAVSTTALLSAQPKYLSTMDKNPSPNAELLRSVNGRTEFYITQADSRQAPVGDVDLLLIDSYHTREQLSIELELNQAFVSTWIVLHDTVTFGERGEDGGLGLLPALMGFLHSSHGIWKIAAYYEHSHGLTVLRRIKE
jgi:hypothetical protein